MVSFPLTLLLVLLLIIAFFGLISQMLPLMVTNRLPPVLHFLLAFGIMIPGTATLMLLVLSGLTRMLVFTNFVMSLLTQSLNTFLVSHLDLSILLIYMPN